MDGKTIRDIKSQIEQKQARIARINIDITTLEANKTAAYREIAALNAQLDAKKRRANRMKKLTPAMADVIMMATSAQRVAYTTEYITYHTGYLGKSYYSYVVLNDGDGPKFYLKTATLNARTVESLMQRGWLKKIKVNDSATYNRVVIWED